MANDGAKLKERLGVEIGPLTRQLFAIAQRVSGESPYQIGDIITKSPIWRCDFYLDFPEPFRFITPTNVVLFGSTGVDGRHSEAADGGAA